MKTKIVELSRKTAETDISLKLNAYGTGEAVLSTGVGFFDHMLTALCRHAQIDLTLTVRGDLAVDCHHTVEDVGIVLGRALGEALSDKTGMERFGSAYVPMDESLSFCALDLSGRSYLVFDCDFAFQKAGDMDTAMVREFFLALASNAGMTVHLKNCCGVNDHHKAESLFKAFARALREAKRVTGSGVPSTKGLL